MYVVVCLIYTPDARGPQARGRGCIYQANHECPCYNFYIPLACRAHWAAYVRNNY